MRRMGRAEKHFFRAVAGNSTMENKRIEDSRKELGIIDLSTYLSISLYLSMALQPFCWAVTDFSFS
jgi:hypothetical protein